MFCNFNSARENVSPLAYFFRIRESQVHVNGPVFPVDIADHNVHNHTSYESVASYDSVTLPVHISLHSLGTDLCSLLSSSQVLPVGRAVAAPPFTFGGQALPVHRVREEVCPQRPPVQTHQSTQLSAAQQDSAHG